MIFVIYSLCAVIENSSLHHKIYNNNNNISVTIFIMCVCMFQVLIGEDGPKDKQIQT